MDNPLIIGSAIVDIVIELDSLPKSGQDILAMSEKISVGGCALNVVCVLKAHDVRHTAFLPIGQGKNANIIQTELKKIKINSLLDVYAGDNGHCYTFIESHGERSFVTLQGIESQFKKEWFSKITEKHSHIYISGYSLLGKGSECIVEYCELNPTSKVIFAPGPVIDVIDLTIFNRILKLAPILHINEDELKKYCRSTELKEQLQEIYNKTKNLVIVTLGERGVSYIENGDISHIEGEQVQVINTSGAGDAHIGAFMVGIAQGLSTEESLKFANKISAKVVSQEDTKFMEENDGKN